MKIQNQRGIWSPDLAAKTFVISLDLLTWWFSRWWFQIFFIFTPICRRFPCWLILFKGVETTNQFLWSICYAWDCFFNDGKNHHDKSWFAKHFPSANRACNPLSIPQLINLVFVSHVIFLRILPWDKSQWKTHHLVGRFFVSFQPPNKQITDNHWWLVKLPPLSYPSRNKGLIRPH